MSPRRGGGGGDRNFPPQEHPGDSYYGRPIINPPVWEEREIAGYLFTGGLAGASSLLAAGADLSGRPALARGARVMATGAISASLLALIKDLGRPERFLNMLRVFKPTSPMSVGVWILFFYGPLAAGTAASDVTGRAPGLGRAAGLAAALLGSTVSTYTAALIANTAVPAWHEGRRELPYLFAGSAASAAGGWGLVVAPRAENGPAVRMAVAGALVELGAEQLLERRLGMIAATLHEGTAGKRLRIARGLTAAGALGAALLGRRNRPAALAAGTALLAGSAFTRFGLFEAGMASARDPKYTVRPQRERLREGG
ncbi:MAG TPA: NrfD/PsrC family molybdoenzyme membrane anchor subunit [Solirubrobacterales bacterium]|nr:NrfD/PsrC family molybdoenzyme membrane anchor subunit [Solirubrobacterales bacterium]